ncbi:hypothetical protein B0H15DRAFT_815437 [Mycena belliarum]|uniref:Uncharacterized protein n=1 Tax=Mycena belliarum TaxID=1033014 RepID=A0AAD6XY78_9AGAR|nr:hypothetical protein B0H15DRAFT_815437 [Mycena belliae]
MAPTKGTLYEYDMILAITQDTINHQFQLIPHEMSLGYLKYDSKKEKWVESKEGVTATIECPTVDLVDCDADYRSVRIKIKMTKATLNYWNEGTLETETLDGYSVSWLARIGQRNVQDLEQEAMTKETKQAIKDSLKEHKDKLPNEVFLITSIFCLFESTRVSNSFKFTNANGKDAAGSDVASTFLTKLQQTYSKMDKKDHPWVLGYGVSVDIPKKDAGTPLFYPSRFWFSTTPLAADPGNSTLNFCIIDNGSHKENLVDPTKNLMAGVLTSSDKTFVDLTRAANLKSDGVMGFSKTQYINRWIVPEILDRCTWASDLVYRKNQSKGRDGRYWTQTVTSTSDSRPKRWTHTVTVDEATRKVHRDDKWDGDWVNYSREYDPVPLPLPAKITWSEKLSGSSTVNIEYWSVLQDKSGSIPIDKKRLIHLKMEGQIKMRTKIRWGTSTDEYDYDQTLDWEDTFHISTTTDGRWTMSPDSNTWNEQIMSTPPGAASGIDFWYFACADGPWGVLDDPLISLPFKKDYINATLKSIAMCVVMPAGNVFTFLGLDSDETGNIYTHIKYKTIP